MERTYSTEQVARKVGIHWTTLHRWLRLRRIRPSITFPLDGRTLWRWTDRDVEKVRSYKLRHYRKGRGRKKKKE
jgi:transposase-like protein